MGTEGMRASLISREIIADSLEIAVRGHPIDSVVGISGCDKTIPGTMMGIGRLGILVLPLAAARLCPASP